MYSRVYNKIYIFEHRIDLFKFVCFKIYKIDIRKMKSDLFEI